MKISLLDLENRAKVRTEGYKEDVLSKGKVVGDFLEIEMDEYIALFKKYNPPRPSARPAQLPKVGCSSCGNKQMPSIGTQINNAANAVGRVAGAIINGNKVLVNKEIADKRHTICQACEFLSNKRCSKCGCYYSTKIQLETEKCPIGKW